MNDIVRWKKSEELKEKIRKQKADLEESERKLESLRNKVTDWSLTGISSFSNTHTLRVKGDGFIEKLKVNELWLNDHIYIDATGFHTVVEKE